MGPDLTAGRARRLFQLPERKDTPAHKFGVTICYEDSVAGLFRKFVRDGADFMVNITNDGWFRDSSELDLHLAICVMRAVENRVAIARCANTGISSFIAPTGAIVKLLERPDGTRREIEGVLQHELTIHAEPGLYTQHGDVFAWACLAALGVMMVSFVRKKRNKAQA